MTHQHAHSLIRFIRNVVGTGGPGHDTDDQLLHRFVLHRDQAAFAALVARHGPMVLGVCGRALRDANDVEDAFQATFLVLARRARSLTRPHLLGHWLHGVARRTALEAKGRTARRHAKEQPIVDVATADPTPQAAWADLRPVLDEEIARLPERYRVPFVMCYLEGRTNGETARLMGCPEGTVASRLSWARQRLRGRLTRRGVTLTAGLCAALLGGKSAVTPALAGCTAEAAASFAGGARAAEPIAANVGSLAAEVLKHMFWAKVRTAAGLLLTVCLLLGGSGALVWSAEKGGGAGAEAAGAREVIVSRPLAREVAEDEEFTGVTGVDSVDVRPRVSGGIHKVHFKEGAEVKRGQLLVEIDARQFQAELDQAAARLAVAEVTQKQKVADYDAIYDVTKDSVAGQKAAAEIKQAGADVEVARAAREQAQASLNWTRVTAPIAGRISGRPAQGDRVRADEDTLATIIANGPAYVYFEAPLRLLSILGEVKDPAGLPVAIGIARERGFPRRGTVSLTGARVDADKGTLQLRAVLPNDGIVSGQSARVRLRTGKPYRALLVPQGAVVSEKTGSFVYVIDDKNRAERRPVELGPAHDKLREVKGGLTASDWVALGGSPGVEPGTTIAPRKVSLLEEAAKPSNVAIPSMVIVSDKGLTLALPLQHTSAAEAARVAKQAYTEQSAPQARLKLTWDDSSNTLFVDGPTDQVLDVARLVAGLEELGRRNPKPSEWQIERRAAERLLSIRTKYYNAFTDKMKSIKPDGPRLGVSVERVSPALADQLSLPRDVGLLVTEVVPRSPAANVGIQANDVLVKIDGAQVPANVDDFIKLIASLKSDTPMDVVVMRKGQRQNLGSVRLGGDSRTIDRDRGKIDELKAQVGQLASDVEMLKERAAWAERMAKKGYMSESELQADRARLRKAETDLDRARRQLKALTPDPKEPAEKGSN
jgi:RND family efflux transporter MFP subunit